MATPAMGFLSRELGRANLDLLALKPSIADLAEGTGFFGNIHTWDPDRESLWRGLKTLGRIRAARYRNALLFFPASHWKFGAFVWATGIPRKLGFAYPHQAWPEKIQSLSLPLDPKAHDTDQNLRLAEAFLGKACGEPRRLLFPLRPLPAELGEDYYVCHPGSSAERGMAEKRLPPAAFADVIKRIRSQFGLRALLIGGPEERDLREAVMAASAGAALTAPSRSLAETAGQIAKARFFLGNDSGLMHVTVALGLPCAAFFGPTDERRTGPYGYWEKTGGRPRHLVLRRTLACAPCWTLATVGDNPPCIFGDTRCLRDFAVDEAWPALRDFIGALPRTVTSGAAVPRASEAPGP